MAAAGLPAVQVLLDAASNNNTFPYDISSYFRLPEGYAITRGRSDELSQPQPGTLSLTLDNTDGRFTLGSTTGGYGAINVDRGIQVRVTPSGGSTWFRFTGYVQAWPTEWPSGSDLFARAQITATDSMARWARRTLRSVIAEEYLLDAPEFYYALSEPAGATFAVESSGNNQPSLTLSKGGAAVVFGTATGPPTDAATAAQFNSGQYLTYQIPPTSNGVRFECFFNTSSTSTVLMHASDGTTILGIDGAGKLYGYAGIVTSAATVSNGATHHALTQVAPTGGGRTELYLDGSLVATSATVLGIGTVDAVGWFNYTGAISHASWATTALSSTRVSRHAAAGSVGLSGYDLDGWTSILSAYAGTPTTTFLRGTPGTTLPWLDFTGKTVAQAIETAADAEQGLVYVYGGGSPTVRCRNWGPGQASPAMTFAVSSDIVDPGLNVEADMTAVVNYATGSREGDGAPTLTYGNTTSQALHGRYPESYTYQVSTDGEVYNRLAWIVNTHAEPKPRIPSLTLDLLSADASVQNLVMQRELDDRIQITGLPAQSPTGTTADLSIEGMTETLSLDGWTVQFNTDSWTAYVQAAVLNDATYGVLNSTTRLAV